MTPDNLPPPDGDVYAPRRGQGGQDMSYGCFNRLPYEDFLLVQDGWLYTEDKTSRVAVMKPVPHTMSTTCQYQLSYEDKLCVGCRHNTRANPNSADAVTQAQ